MKVLVVGGTGLIGGHAALFLAERGHEVTLAARSPAPAGSPLGSLPFLQGSYLADDFTVQNLAGFDTLIFAAGNDIRHVPEGDDQAAHWQRANVEGVPKFFKQARDAGIGTAVYVGSFYPQAAPQLVEKSAYIRGRKLADDGARALNAPGFRVCSVNAPFVIGTVPQQIVPSLQAHALYALGRFPQLPLFAMPGGVNFISTTSLTTAIVGALECGAGGKAYLVGDENLTFQEYFGEMVRAAGGSGELPVIDQEHPMLPDSAIYAGRGGTIYYEPPADEVALLGYARQDVKRTLREIVEFYR